MRHGLWPRALETKRGRHQPATNGAGVVACETWKGHGVQYRKPTRLLVVASSGKLGGIRREVQGVWVCSLLCNMG